MKIANFDFRRQYKNELKRQEIEISQDILLKKNSREVPPFHIFDELFDYSGGKKTQKITKSRIATQAQKHTTKNKDHQKHKYKLEKG